MEAPQNNCAELRQNCARIAPELRQNCAAYSARCGIPRDSSDFISDAAITDTSTIELGTSVRVISPASLFSTLLIDASAAKLSSDWPFGAPSTETAEVEPTDQRARKDGKREPPSLSAFDESSEATLRAEVDHGGWFSGGD